MSLESLFVGGGKGKAVVEELEGERHQELHGSGGPVELHGSWGAVEMEGTMGP